MNLTQTKRWKEFEDWYDRVFYEECDKNGLGRLIPISDMFNISFTDLSFEFQEGVYRKFIESLVDADNENLYLIETENFPRKFYLNSSRYIGGITKSFNTFQELVEHFFNNEQ